MGMKLFPRLKIHYKREFGLTGFTITRLLCTWLTLVFRANKGENGIIIFRNFAGKKEPVGYKVRKTTACFVLGNMGHRNWRPTRNGIQSSTICVSICVCVCVSLNATPPETNPKSSGA